ncbi:dimethylhistidine N-methyltransferase [Oxalobacteraceae bacterium GrIS 2.11]
MLKTTATTLTESGNAANNHDELTKGLMADHACISPKFFYDSLGSVLFEAICQLPEYYLTRIESQIIKNHLTEFAHAVASGGTLIDLGAGNCAKAARLFSHLHPDQYVPIDISVDHLTDAVQRLQQRFPHIEMTAIGMDFSGSWSLPVQVRNDRRLFFYPGSSIGNFPPDAALAFLKNIRAECDVNGGLLIGVDLVKNPAVLNAAYDDNLGVTSAFNLNALRHVNQVLGSDFDIRQWQHIAFFNTEKSRIEMHLEARMDLDVCWAENRRHFMAGERIHTENSYKYQLPQFLTLLADAGFGKPQYWTDENEWFAIVYAKAI